MLNSILSNTTASITLAQLGLCTAASLLLGLVCAGAHQFRNHSNKSFLITLVLLPAVVQMVIFLVNGNLGAGVAVAGAFSLVRFRSLPGSAREIGSVFLAMAVGLATGMGYLGLAALFTAALCAVEIILVAVGFGEDRSGQRELRLTVPEALEYEEAFEDIFKRNTQKIERISVKTTNMGSLFELRYRVTLRPGAGEKQFLDALRTRNGNLPVQLLLAPTREDQL